MYLMVRSFCRDNIVEMVSTTTRRNCLPTPSLGRCSRSKTCIVSTNNLVSSPDPASTLDNLAWYPGCVGGEKCFSPPTQPGYQASVQPKPSTMPLSKPWWPLSPCKQPDHFLPLKIFHQLLRRRKLNVRKFLMCILFSPLGHAVKIKCANISYTKKKATRKLPDLRYL